MNGEEWTFITDLSIECPNLAVLLGTTYDGCEFGSGMLIGGAP